MKKLSKFIFVFILMFLCGGIVFLPSSFSYADENSEIEIEINGLTDLNNGFVNNYSNPDATFILKDDIVLTGNDSINIPSSEIFKGTFDGNGHTIKNLKLQKDGLYYGLFPKANGATIKNLRIEGDVIFDCDTDNLQEVYAGVIIGYGENVTIENCELASVIINKTQNEELPSEIAISSDLNFGAFAGKIKSDLGRTSASIKNCVSYTDVKIKMNNNSTLKIGGIVGENEQSIIINSLAFGGINVLSGLNTTPDVEKYQFIGGIAGYVSGTYSKVQNTCFGGLIVVGQTNEIGEVIGGLTGLNVKKGAIVGGVSSTNTPNAQNFYFDYWTDSSLSCVGEGLTIAYSKSKRVEVINKDFLTTTGNFNGALPGWDFNYTWTMKESKLILQRFLTFKYKFAATLDRNGVLENATFVEKEADDDFYYSYKYGEKVKMKIVLKEDAKQFYKFGSLYLNSQNVAETLYDCEEEIGTYTITLTANDMTDGTYSFLIPPVVFDCEIIAESVYDDQGNLQDQGGVKISGASSTVKNMTVSFSKNAATKSITAVGKGIFIFDYWTLYYQQDDGWEIYQIENDAEELVDWTNANSTISIEFGKEPFNKVFRLEAHFTDKGAVTLKFPTIDTNRIVSLKINGDELVGSETACLVSPNATSTLEIVTNKGFELKYDDFINRMGLIYGDKTFIMTSNPILDEESGATTYKFNIVMKNAKNLNESDKGMEFLFVVEQNNKTNSGASTIIIIVIVLVVAATAGGVTAFVIIKKKKGGKGKGKSNRSGQKKTTYSDYYI